MKTITATSEQCVLKWEATVGESPLWHPQQKRLYWVDIQGKKVHRFDPVTGRNETFATPEIVPCLAICASGGLVLLLRKNIAFFDPDTGKLEMGQAVESDQPDNRFNDGRVDPQGRFWPGTMCDKNMKVPTGGLYRLTPDLKITRLHDRIACSNGSAWSPDGRTMYFTESFRFTVWAFDFDPDTGNLSNQRAFVTLPKGDIFPDGLCVDADGFVWSNHVGAGKVVRYDPNGQAEAKFKSPCPAAPVRPSAAKTSPHCTSPPSAKTCPTSSWPPHPSRAAYLASMWESEACQRSLSGAERG